MNDVWVICLYFPKDVNYLEDFVWQMENQSGDKSGGAVHMVKQINGIEMENSGSLEAKLSSAVGMHFHYEMEIYDMYQNYGQMKGFGKVRVVKMNGKGVKRHLSC